APAEEALLRNGRRALGELSCSKNGRWSFTPTGNAEPMTWDDIEQVRISPSAPPSPRMPQVHRILLNGDEAVTGEILGFNSENLRLKTGWTGADLVIPFHFINSIEHAGPATVFVDTLEESLQGWKVTGKPISGGIGERGWQAGALLNAGGKGIRFELPEPLNAGRIGVNFEVPVHSDSELSWLGEAEFQADNLTNQVRVIFSGKGDHYGVEVPGGNGIKGSVLRRP